MKNVHDHDPAIPGPSRPGALRTLLRQATVKDHQAIDHHPMLAPLVRPGLGLEHYVRVLGTFYWLYVPLHERLLAGLRRFGGGTGYLPSDRLAWLREDLAFFDRDGRGAEGFPTLPERPPLASAAELIGELYVLEGSTLGGQVIARVLEDRLGIAAHGGGRFFHGNGERTGERWEAFWALAEHLVPETQASACVRAARDLFGHMSAALALAYADRPARQGIPGAGPETP